MRLGRFTLLTALALMVALLQPAVERQYPHRKYVNHPFILPTNPPKTAEGKPVEDYRPELLFK